MKRTIVHCTMLAGLAFAAFAMPALGEETKEQAVERQRREQEDRINAIRAQLPQPPTRGNDQNPGDPQAPLDPRGPIEPGYRPATEQPNNRPDAPPARPRRVVPGNEPVKPTTTAPPPPRSRPINPRVPGGTPPRRLDVGDLFRKLDTDGDGVLSMEEFRHVFDRPDAMASPPDAPPRKPDAARDAEPRLEGNDLPPPPPPSPIERTGASKVPSDAPPAAWRDEPSDGPAAPKTAAPAK